jgi:hypothetical protein
LSYLDRGLTLAGAVIASAICAGCGGSGHSSGRSPVDPAALSVLDRAPTEKDRLSPTFRRQLAGPGLVRDSGGDVGAARQTVPGVWVIPAGQRVCAAVEFPRVALAESCGPRAKIGNALFVVGRLVRARGPVIAGLVGDGVTRIQIRLADGRIRSVRVLDNGFRSPPLPRRPVSLSFRGPAGVQLQDVVQAPAP